MQSSNNLAVIAAAGSRKTQHIIDCVVADPSKRVLVTTYTNENLHQIVNRLSAGTGVLPGHVTVMGWFTFLLNECARPYQSFVLGETGMMGGLNFVGQRSRYIPKSKPQQYYLDRGKSAYRDGVSAFSFEANRLSKGMVVDRLSRMYDHIYIDEIQDMAGYDLELLDLLMKSPIAVTVVGDPRQATFVTNNAAKNKQFKGSGIVDWLSKRAELCLVENRVESYRCNQEICDFADDLYPDLARTVSKNTEITGHDGIFEIKKSDAPAYAEQYAPVVLRYNKNSDTCGLEAMNMGTSKGSTFDRVLIFPTAPMIKYCKTKDASQAGDRAKLYVAVTRAKYSAAFVMP
ncbi:MULTISPECIES: UvrD-helicase domain-containing protein [unclassified Streptomyces]|uniref:UvrD-helicase domain-containing protein n=1 Tax=unclassified Streptomyces TaxID=2593676 RepID=UPI0022551E8D|nr:MULTISPECIES: UvrD-helicase domain-containing protein [unclassified Streptomyces]MCX5063774.1 UvrD-helicase domain-containing protein [Streptomyces sp. NBC_00452]MCX5294168.1 UvrD-helicase domain-containing protein [Streptomyces sp. NBC_00183]